MKNLSNWGKNNPVKTILIITACHLLMMLNALGTGALLYVFDYGYFKWSFIIAASVFGMAYLLYPKKNKAQGLFRYSYMRQKSHDLMLVLSFALVVTFGFNNFLTIGTPEYNTSPNASARLIVHKTNPDAGQKSDNSFKSRIKKKIKDQRKELRSELRGLKKAFKNDEDRTLIKLIKALLIILTICVMVVLGFLVAYLACAVTCSGSGVLGVLTLLAGWTGVVLLSIFVIKKIVRKVGTGPLFR